MANRILKDSIWNSRSLAKLDDFTQDQFPRWLLMADDWGCFDADLDVIKGLVYPKRPKVTTKIIERVRLELHESGHLFCWVEGDHAWAYWTSWGEHNYTTSVEEGGKRSQRRRKTPEPPAELLQMYLDKYNQGKTTSLLQSAAPCCTPLQGAALRDKSLDPDLDPDPDLDSDLDHKSEVVEEVAPVTPVELHEIYNRERGGLPECRVLTETRKQKCRVRITERNKDPASFRSDFTEAVCKARGHPFLSGGGSRGWKADFDFIIENDKNYLRILEGRYDWERKSKAQERNERQNNAVRTALSDLDAPFGGNLPITGIGGDYAGEN